jgi:carboxyl-terminal processing protease
MITKVPIQKKETKGEHPLPSKKNHLQINKYVVIAFTVIFFCTFSVGYLFGKNSYSSIVSFSLPAFINVTGDNASSSAFISPEKKADLTLFWDVWKRLELNYVDKSKLDTQKMVFGAIQGMTKALGDPYTVFLPPQENKEAREDLSGSFEGIGAQLGMKNERIVVIAPLQGMPAEKAGIKAGDYILAVDGVETYGWSVPETVEKIRGPKNSKVKLTILHDGGKESEEVNIVRDRIEVPTVKIDFKNDIAILSLYQFGELTNEQWTSAVSEIRKTCYKEGKFICKGVILDVRNNPGGLLDGAVYIASEFIPDGVIVTQQFGNGKRNEYKVNRKGQLLDVPTVVLVNKGSASASEIVAGALKVRDGAKLIGEKTFGKGSIQDREELPGGAGLHITTAKWLLPDDSWINGTGITPDIEVFDDEKTTEVDEQLEKAIQLFSEEK